MIRAQGIDSNTIGFFPCIGPNAGTTIKDRMGNMTLTPGGNAVLSTGASKFADSSLYSPGVTGDYASVSSMDSYKSLFTIDFWIKTTVSTGRIIAFAVGASPAWGVNLQADKIYISSTGSDWDIANGVTVGLTYDGVWHHIAIVFSGTNYYVFQDGVQKFTTASTSIPCDMSVGTLLGHSGGIPTGGYVQALRISKIARWTSAFSPPTMLYGGGSAP